MRIALGQINTTVGDLTGNVDKMLRMAELAVHHGADLVIFPELAINGYPPRDLLEKATFLDRTTAARERLARESAHLPVGIVYGFVGPSSSSAGKRVMNAACVLSRGRIIFEQHKMLLPTYDVFDESRYFEPAAREHLWLWRDRKIALTICEDAWNDKQFWERQLYQRDPVSELVEEGAELLISINASPYHMGKRSLRFHIFETTARRHGIPVIYVNQVGGNDQLIFDGTSFVIGAKGELLALAPSFEEDLLVVDLSGPASPQLKRGNYPDEHEAVYQALVLGTRDYIRKCGFERVIIGLSGGIDSSLTAAIAVDAVGRDNVTGVAMPGPYSSDHSLTDARQMAQRLGIRFEVCPIHQAYEACLRTLAPQFIGYPEDVTEENIQSRLRGLTLMALSNKFGALVLTTGNKSELAVGYCTLYGDMCGGLAVISDVPKTMVYELARVANRRHQGAIPESVFQKPPSAELRPNQKDTDSLPEYSVLDPILKAYVEDLLSPHQIADALQLPLDLVREIVNKVDRNEYKRQQAAPGLKVTTKAFGMGRRFPIAHKFFE
ncbi:MAG: NAD+ synthase [Bryobacteraceae bacterium]|nr:NAD+ synthase [Bryobacteraceae bacterium]MDW8380187.1 NAD+ synthase [Bryobacterales bacterium]